MLSIRGGGLGGPGVIKDAAWLGSDDEVMGEEGGRQAKARDR